MSRPPTPPTMPSVTVPMGGLGFVNRTTGNFTLITSVGGYHAQNGTIQQQDKRGLFTRGMTACFTVIVMGSGGAIMAHVSAYLAHANLEPAQRAELKDMKDGFARLWNAHRTELSPTRVVIIKGEFTNDAQMRSLISQIFPQVAGAPKTEFQCQKNPYPRTALHGTATILLLQAGTSVYVEEKRKM